MRVLLAARLSQTTEGQTGIESQDADARAWAVSNGHTVIATAADKISSQVAPWDRHNLGPWMRDADRLARYDAIVAAKQDRLSRAKWRDETEIRRWAEDHRKELFIVDTGLHWPPRDMSDQIRWEFGAIAARQEWEATSKRYRRMQRYLKDNDYFVGRPPFGYAVVPKNDHKTLAPDPVTSGYVRGMVERSLSGQTLAAIAQWLNSEGVATVRGGQWIPRTVSQVLRNPMMTGRRKDRHGRTVLRVEPIIDLATFRQLQHRLDNDPRRRGPESGDTALLTGILFCGKCQGPMYRFRTTNTRKDGSKQYNWYYRCKGTPNEPSTCHNMIPLDQIESYVSDQLTGEVIGSDEVIERVTLPGEGYADEIDQLEQDLRELNFDAPDFLERQATLLAERKRLLALPVEPDRTVARRTGVTIAEHWRSLDDAGKRAYLLDAEANVYAVRVPKGQEVGRPSRYPRLAASIALQRI